MHNSCIKRPCARGRSERGRAAHLQLEDVRH